VCCDTTRGQPPVRFPCRYWSPVPSWTQCFVQVLSVHKLQITDNEYLDAFNTFPQEPHCLSVHDNLFCYACPCASTTRLGNHAAVFHRAIWWCNAVLRLHYALIICVILQLVICCIISKCLL
jgi:hypothetical protein